MWYKLFWIIRFFIYYLENCICFEFLILKYFFDYLLININEKNKIKGGEIEIWWLVLVIFEFRLLLVGYLFRIYLFVIYWVCFLYGVMNSSFVLCGMVESKKMNGTYLYWEFIVYEARLGMSYFII